MEARIVKEIKGAKPADVKELLLDECKSEKIVGLTEEFSGLTTLSLANVGLKSLEGLPKLPLLTTINLSDNHLESGLEVLVQNCPMLNHVNLAANPIKNLETLLPMQKLTKLSSLDLAECEVAEQSEFRQKVFETLPQVTFLDGVLKGKGSDAGSDLSSDEDDEEEEEFSMSEGEESGEEEIKYPDSYISQPSEKGDQTDVPQKKVKNDGEPMDSSEVESKESAMES
ncbi:leucine-rich repeat domain-containing protein [Ditylenchus destructor]|uniref:Leucine-rich repeat domain-containing protein n=1 Tax=Ditylenchus destructor TaxID=166010 RepID=A0AAD4N132_9BILA|nr:leucine-rich repeat domain-containing protein [Ditylenchus destructor]